MNYNRAEYLPDAEEKVARLQALVKGRPVAILAAGPSIKQLEERIGELANEDICYFGFNKFTQEEHILKQIGERLTLFMASDRECIPPVMDDIFKFLDRGDRNIFLSSFWRNTFELTKIDINQFIKTYDKKLLFFSLKAMPYNASPNSNEPLHFFVGNSLQILIQIAMISKSPRIVLFGADGGYPKGATECYYRQGEYWDKKGVNEALIFDTNWFNVIMPVSCRNTCETFGLMPPEIINCLSESNYNVFPRVTYDEAIKYLKGEK